MSKNIVICCDGTGNEFGNENSNVVKLYSTLVINETQIGYYHPGVGTMGSAAARNKWEKQWDRIKGMAFGYGLSSNISDAYRYLMDTYADGDRVFVFGFSRGAYTARALAGVLHMYGLLCPGNEGLIPYVVRMFSACSRQAGGLEPDFRCRSQLQEHIFATLPAAFPRSLGYRKLRWLGLRSHRPAIFGSKSGG